MPGDKCQITGGVSAYACTAIRDKLSSAGSLTVSV